MNVQSYQFDLNQMKQVQMEFLSIFQANKQVHRLHRPCPLHLGWVTRVQLETQKEKNKHLLP